MFFFFNDTATTEIYTLSLHDALPICIHRNRSAVLPRDTRGQPGTARWRLRSSSRCFFSGRSACSRPRSCCSRRRSEEHTSELQSRQYLVCRLLLEKKKKKVRLLDLMS